MRTTSTLRRTSPMLRGIRSSTARRAGALLVIGGLLLTGCSDPQKANGDLKSSSGISSCASNVKAGERPAVGFIVRVGKDSDPLTITSVDGITEADKTQAVVVEPAPQYREGGAVFGDEKSFSEDTPAWASRVPAVGATIKPGEAKMFIVMHDAAVSPGASQTWNDVKIGYTQGGTESTATIAYAITAAGGECPLSGGGTIAPSDDGGASDAGHA